MGTEKKRLYGLDILRLLCIVAISLFHAINLLIESEQQGLGLENQSFFSYIYEFARFFSNSGHLIVAISFFLLGYNQTRLSSIFRVFVFCLLGVVVLALMQYQNDFYIEWDIFHYLVSSLLLILILRWMKVSHIAVAVVSCLLLLWPNWYDAELLTTSSTINAALWGKSIYSDEGGWFLLPWVFLSSLFWAFGSIYRVYTGKPTGVLYYVTTAALLCGGASFISLFQNTLLFEYYKYQFSIPPIKHIFYFGLFLVFLKINFLDESRIALFLKNLRWNKSFGVCYFLQILLFIPASLLQNHNALSLAEKIDFVFIIFLIAPEVSAQIMFFMAKKFRSRSQTNN